MHVPSRFYVPIPMHPVMNHIEADNSRSYQQALSAQSFPPKMRQLPA